MQALGLWFALRMPAAANQPRLRRLIWITTEICAIAAFLAVALGLGPVERHVERLEALRALGVDQFALYLQHDDNDATLEAYGETIIPAMIDSTTASS